MVSHGRKGRSVPQDDAEAMKWYRLAAKQGVPQNDVLAYMWFSLAAAQGDENAQENRDMAANLMTPDQIAEAQRMAQEWMAKHQQ